MASKSMFTKYSDGEVVVLSALRSELEESFKSTKELAKILNEENIKITRLGSVYITKNGGAINIKNYYGKKIIPYLKEVPYGYYLNQNNELETNCNPIPTIINGKVEYVVPKDFNLVAEEVIADSISYDDLEMLELEDNEIYDKVENKIKKSLNINE